MKRKIKLSLLLALFISVILSCCKARLDLPDFNNEITDIEFGTKDNENIYLVMNTGELDYIVALDKNLDIDYTYSRKKFNKNETKEITDSAVDQKGNIYFLNTYTNLEQNVQTQSVKIIKNNRLIDEETGVVLDSHVIYKSLSIETKGKDDILRLVGEDANNIYLETWQKDVKDKTFTNEQKDTVIYKKADNKLMYSLALINNNVMGISQAGKIYSIKTAKEEAHTSFQLTNYKNLEGNPLLIKGDLENKIYIVSEGQGDINQITSGDETSRVVYWGHKSIKDYEEILYQDAYNIAFKDQKNFVLAVRLRDKVNDLGLVVVKDGEKTQLLNTFKLSFKVFLRLAFKQAWKYYLISLVVIITLMGLMNYMRKSKYLIVRVMLPILPILLIGIFGVLIQKSNKWCEECVEQFIEENLITYSNYQKDILESLDNETQLDLSYHIMLKKDEELIVAQDEERPIGYHVKSLVMPKEYKMYEEVLQGTKKANEVVYKDGIYSTYMVPIISADGQQGVLEVGINKAYIKCNTNEYLKSIRLYAALALIIMFIGIMVILQRNLKPLNSIEKLLNDWHDNNDVEELKLTSKDEVFRISNLIYNILKKEQIQKYTLKQNTRTYIKFVPDMLTKLFDKENVNELFFRETVKKEMPFALTLLKDLEGMDENEYISTSTKGFKLINEVTCEYEGFLHVLDGYFKQIVSLYMNTPDKAMEANLMLSNHLQGAGLNQVTIIDQQEVKVVLSGDKDRIYPVVLSKRIKLLSGLTDFFKHSGCHILFTGEVMGCLKEKGCYEYRYIGYILDREKNKIDLYDLYQEEKQEIKDSKNKTKAIFDKALRLFYERKFYEAMNLFLRVIEENRDDEIARMYAFRAESLYKNWDGYDELELIKSTND